MARGHLRQRAKNDSRSWSLRVELSPDPVTGKRRQKRATFRGTKRDAEAALAKMVAAARANELGDAGRLTVAELLERYCADTGHEAKTRRGYKQLARNQINPLIGKARVDRLTAMTLAGFRDRLADVRRRDRPEDPGEPIATSTQLKAFNLVHAALNRAVEWRLIPFNPAAAVKAPRPSTKEIEPLTRAQAALFVAALEAVDLFWRAYFLVMLSTGVRLAELCGLRWRDIDLERGTVRVAQTIAYVEGEGSREKGERGRVTKPRAKSRAGARVLPVDPDLVAVLTLHQAAQVARQLNAGPLWADRGLAFPGPFGRPLDDSPVRKELDAVCTAAKVPRITPHDLRHTMATLMLTAGVNVKVVSERLGHSDVATTMRIYAHVLPGLQEEAALTMGRLIRPTPVPEVFQQAFEEEAVTDAPGEGG